MQREQAHDQREQAHDYGTWHQRTPPAVVAQLASDVDRGLSTLEVARRRADFGPNELVERAGKSAWRILWEQLTATLVVVLIFAAVLSALLGDWQDAIAILTIIVLNALLGFRQEYSAEKAMAALKKLAVPTVKVRRDGHVGEISAREIVRGDVVMLEAGSAVPADSRLIEAVNLRVQESALTGESEPVEKDAETVLDEDQPLAERRNMAYMGTSVAYGRGTAVITATGMDTELGKIAAMIQKVVREPTPLQRRLDQLGRTLAIVALLIVAVIFAIGIVRGEPWKLMFLTAVSLAVAAVPEGLPAVVTIALALGAQRMLKRNALIRKLPAVETLGSVTTICSDKTGTLTKNQMTVAVIDVAGQRIDATGDRFIDPARATATQPGHKENQATLALLLTAGELCNDAILETNDPGGGSSELHVVGDPTEAALVSAATRFGLSKTSLEKLLPRVHEVPFDSERKRMTTVHRYSGSTDSLPSALTAALSAIIPPPKACRLVFTKGAIDSLIEVTSRVWVDDHETPLDERWRDRIQTAHDQLAEKGMRVLGIGFRTIDGNDSRALQQVESNLTFLGLVGIIDPPRPEVRSAVDTCTPAGIRPVMITGDHPLTSRYIAGELGISDEPGVLTGKDLDKLSADKLDTVATQVAVHARVTPEHKLKLVEALQRRGHIVAMTGDGVNDAPALKKADIGIAMGITGTDVSKEAADMILRDDNFTTIVAAIEQGRIIFDNIRKFVRYLLSANVGEIWVMLLGPLLGMPLPLWPLQILWMNLVTDGFPALALGVEPAERNVMRRRPYPPDESIFARGIGVDIIWIGLLMGFVSLGVGFVYWSTELATWQTMLFTTLTFSQMTLALAVRSERDSLFRIGVFSNKPLLAAICLTLVLQLGVIYVPFLQNLFKTVPLGARDLALAFLLSTVVFWAVELRKLLSRIRYPAAGARP